jgi:peptidoglycan pentaglycine glycine transferase (the first glycine)
MTLTAQIITDRDQWNSIMRQLPYAHILQSWEWGDFKQQTIGWIPQRIAYYQDGQVVAGASLLTRKVMGLRVMYVPKGPSMDYSDSGLVESVLSDLQTRAKGALWLKIDPDVVQGYGVPNTEEDQPQAIGQAVMDQLQARGWTFSDDQVQFRNTVTLDLSPDEETLLMQMSQNTRRKVRTAEKKGVTVRVGTQADLPTLYQLYKTTGERDNFLIRPPEYYEKAWRDFMQADLAHVLIAEAEGQPIAHVILFHFGKTCWYFYGASSNEERNRMPNYLLQWEAMKWAKSQGYTSYDMWGAPDNFIESDSMWGVYEFKRGFRGDVTRYIGAWDYMPNKMLYALYTRVRRFMRR